MAEKYTKEMLEEAVAESLSFSDVVRKVGARLCGGTWCHIKRKIVLYEIDTSHFKKKTEFLEFGKKFPPEKLMVLRNSGKRQHAYILRRAMVESGIEYMCVLCGITNQYNNLPITLEINHRNHNWLDDRSENVEFMCPNCHSQYHVQAAKNKKRCD